MRITVTGGEGFLGRRLVNQLWEEGHVVTPISHHKYDLLREQHVWQMFEDTEPEVVVHAAASVGGIIFNKKCPGGLFYENIVMGINMMEAARHYVVKKFVQIGTVCEYPKFTRVPFKESDLWEGYPEETNAPYGVAKKALLVMGQAYREQYGLNAIHLLPANMYGPGDNFHPESSHVIPGLIVRILKAVGEGAPEVVVSDVSREFLYVDDAARAIASAVALYDKPEPVNIGTGKETTIGELANMIARKVGYEGRIVVRENSIPGGQPRRQLDVTKAAQEFNFQAKTELSEGLDKTIEWYKGTQQ